MLHTVLCTGDINLMNVTDHTVPFRRIAPTLKKADVIFSNLECYLYDPPHGHPVENEGFWAPSNAGIALRDAGIAAVGNANNVNYGEAAIQASNRRLDELGILHSGSGNNVAEARKPVVLVRGGIRYGFLQRTSVYWPTNHEAGTAATGVAVIKGHTAYQVPIHKTRPNVPPFNRPGLPPVVVTWADSEYLAQFTFDVAELRKQCDVLVVSCHWGLDKDVLQYMTEIAHAAINAGADIVFGHGPHFPLPIEIYRGKPVFYGLGSFSFHAGHGGLKHGDWVGLLASIAFRHKAIDRVSFRFVRHTDENETILRSAEDERDALANIQASSDRYGTKIQVEHDEAVCTAAQA